MIRNALFVGLTAIASAAAAQTPDPFVATAEKEVTGTIQAISQSDRHVVLKVDGQRLLVEAGPGVRNFNQVKPGDTVVVTYREGVIAEVKPPGEGAQGSVASKATVPGTPAAAAGKAVATTVKITSVDPQTHTVTFTRPDGIDRTMSVTDPKAQVFASKLQAGDEVQVTYKEAVAVNIEPVAAD